MLSLKLENLEISLTNDNIGIIKLICDINDDINDTELDDEDLLYYIHNKYSSKIIDELSRSRISPRHCNNIIRSIISGK